MEPNENIGQRVAVIETKLDNYKEELETISRKLDSLLELKSRGLGALWLVGIIIGSGALGLIVTIMNFIKPHL